MNETKLMLICLLILSVVVPSVLGVKAIVQNVVVEHTPLDLVAGSSIEVFCNATLLVDPTAAASERVSGNTTVNATFYDNNTVGSAASDSLQFHYTNNSCSRVDNTTFTMNYTCGFIVSYNAINGSNWVCNVTSADIFDTTNENVSSNNTEAQAEINQLIAIEVGNVSMEKSGGGDLALGDTSAEALLNITNFGNVPINLTVKSNEFTSMNCTTGVIANNSFIRFNVTNIATPITMALGLNLTNIAVPVPDMTIPPQSVDSIMSLYNISWIMQAPATGVGGACNGSVDVTAVLQ